MRAAELRGSIVVWCSSVFVLRMLDLTLYLQVIMQQIHTIVDAAVSHQDPPEPHCQRNQRKDSRMAPPTTADMPRFCAPAPVNTVELGGDVPDDGGTGETVGVVILRAEVFLSLASVLIDEITALDLARTDAVTLGVSGWVVFLNPFRPDDAPAE